MSRFRFGGEIGELYWTAWPEDDRFGINILTGTVPAASLDEEGDVVPGSLPRTLHYYASELEPGTTTTDRIRIESGDGFFPVMYLEAEVFIPFARDQAHLTFRAYPEGQLPPYVALSKTTIELESEDGSADSDTLSVVNAGEAELEWTILDECSWASPVPASGTLLSGELVEVEFVYDASPPPDPGLYEHAFPLESNDPESPVITIDATLTVEGSSSGVDDDPTTSLDPLVRNPSGPNAELAFTVAEPGPVSLRVYDLSGRLMRTLVDENKSPGQYEVRWDGRAERGGEVASGMYYFLLDTPGANVTRSMAILK